MHGKYMAAIQRQLQLVDFNILYELPTYLAHNNLGGEYNDIKMRWIIGLLRMSVYGLSYDAD